MISVSAEGLGRVLADRALDRAMVTELQGKLTLRDLERQGRRVLLERARELLLELRAVDGVMQLIFDIETDLGLR